MNKTTNILLLLLFLGINTAVYFITQNNAQSMIDNELEDSVYAIETHKDILLTAQKNISNTMYKTMLRNSDAQELLAASFNASKEQQAKNREKLYAQLLEHYELSKKQGVLQVHFVDKNNITFLRMHKPSKFGDDLTNIRNDYAYVNKTQKETSGFSAGRTTHGFRNVYPVFGKNNVHIGAVEVSFSSAHLQWYLNHVSDIHSHFLIHRNLLDTTAWRANGLVLEHAQSAEAKSYLLTLNDTHTQTQCIDENTLRLHSIKDEILSKIEEGYDFASYLQDGDSIIVVSFLPITNEEDQILAWIVTYNQSPIIKNILENTITARMVTFFSLLVILLLFRKILLKQEMQKQNMLFDTVLNATDDMLFVTDFKGILFSNNRFKKLFSSKKDLLSDDADDADDFCILDIFMNKKGYLHKDLLENNENIFSLLNRTKDKDKVVLLTNEENQETSFKIDIQTLEEEGDSYLVHLTDISELREELLITSNKAYTDALTNVYNRSKFDEILNAELQRVQRYKQPLTLALIDVDHFKNFNDTYGHLIGDEVLISIAQNVNSNIRNTDTFARWGGEEFVVLFTEVGVDIAKNLSLKLKSIVQEEEHPTAGRVTISLGLTEYKDGDTLLSIFKRCDEALYIAKSNGRNRVEVIL